ncbi:hypothetical protein E2562_032281 [Oryza meyeriana var. granulata]|uniref:Uncharacterized protein n=1 Tax=Oryza meyeriana var. granulata TaxID=110450 RepID=A0A6G1F0J0_9ORYZ|nr:hypothetical protein E2562_032281 [Oryza meyeriana var. granulata]
MTAAGRRHCAPNLAHRMVPRWPPDPASVHLADCKIRVGLLHGASVRAGSPLSLLTSRAGSSSAPECVVLSRRSEVTAAWIHLHRLDTALCVTVEAPTRSAASPPILRRECLGPLSPSLWAPRVRPCLLCVASSSVAPEPFAQLTPIPWHQATTAAVVRSSMAATAIAS